MALIVVCVIWVALVIPVHAVLPRTLEQGPRVVVERGSEHQVVVDFVIAAVGVAVVRGEIQLLLIGLRSPYSSAHGLQEIEGLLTHFARALIQLQFFAGCQTARFSLLAHRLTALVVAIRVQNIAAVED